MRRRSVRLTLEPLRLTRGTPTALILTPPLSRFLDVTQLQVQSLEQSLLHPLLPLSSWDVTLRSEAVLRCVRQ